MQFLLVIKSLRPLSYSGCRCGLRSRNVKLLEKDGMDMQEFTSLVTAMDKVQTTINSSISKLFKLMHVSNSLEKHA